MACVEEDSSNVSDLIGWAITIISNVDACDVGWPRQTKEWQEAARNWLDAVAKE